MGDKGNYKGNPTSKFSIQFSIHLNLPSERRKGSTRLTWLGARKVQGKHLRIVGFDVARDLATQHDIVNANVAHVVTRSQKLPTGRDS